MMKPNITGLEKILKARAAARIVKGPWRDFALNAARSSEQKMAVWALIEFGSGHEFMVGFESLEAYVSDSPSVWPAVSVPLENAVVYRFNRLAGQVSMDSPYTAEQLMASVDSLRAIVVSVVVMGQLCDGVRTESILKPQPGRAVIGVRPRKSMGKEMEEFARALLRHGWLEAFPKAAEGRLDIQWPPNGGLFTISRPVI